MKHNNKNEQKLKINQQNQILKIGTQPLQLYFPSWYQNGESYHISDQIPLIPRNLPKKKHRITYNLSRQNGGSGK